MRGSNEEPIIEKEMSDGIKKEAKVNCISSHVIILVISKSNGAKQCQIITNEK